MSEEKDYAYFSEALHSSYLFYTLEVDKLNKQNKRLREAITHALNFIGNGEQELNLTEIENVHYTLKQALGE